jgi:hypothetical protein
VITGQLGAITIVLARLPEHPLPSVTVMVNVNVPGVVGPPRPDEISSSVNAPAIVRNVPGGIVPTLTVGEYGGVPPLSVVAWK